MLCFFVNTFTLPDDRTHLTRFCINRSYHMNIKFELRSTIKHVGITFFSIISFFTKYSYTCFIISASTFVLADRSLNHSSAKRVILYLLSFASLQRFSLESSRTKYEYRSLQMKRRVMLPYEEKIPREAFVYINMFIFK